MWKKLHQLDLSKVYLISWPSSESFLYLAVQWSSFCAIYFLYFKDIVEMICFLTCSCSLTKVGLTSAWTLAMAASMSFWLYFRTSMMDSSTPAGCGNGVTRLSRIGGCIGHSANKLMSLRLMFYFEWGDRVRDVRMQRNLQASEPHRAVWNHLSEVLLQAASRSQA